MAIVNHAKREINAKIVYYGPEGAGKGTSLRYIYERVKPSLRGELKSLPSGGASLLCFDFSPFDQVFGGYRLRLHVYTLHGRVTNAAAWKMTLKGADGLVIVGDASAPSAVLRQSVAQVREFLSAYGVGIDSLPVVLQLNKQDLAGTVEPALLLSEAGLPEVPCSLTAASRGEGVLEALTGLTRVVMERLGERDDLQQELPASAPLPEAPDHVADAAAQLTNSEAAPSSADLNVPGVEEVEDQLQVRVVQEGIMAEGGQVRIPLELSQGGMARRLVVRVLVETE